MKRRIGIIIISIILLVMGGCLKNEEQNKTGNETVPVQETVLKIHYQRSDKTYTGWGLHLWGGAIAAETEWTAPQLPKTAGEEAYFEVKIADLTKPLNFIIHKGETKDVESDRVFPDISKNKEVWLYEGDSTVYTQSKGEISWKPQLYNESFFIDVEDTSVKLLFKTDTWAKVNIYVGESENNLVKVKESITPGARGVIIDNLTGGKDYFYKIEAVNGNEATVSKINSFKKLERTNNWIPAEWARTAVFYEVFVRSFYDGSGDGIGDFKGLKEKIPYLKELGVNALWLMPTNKSPSYHGYDVVDYRDTEPDYGTKEEFQDLLREAHKNGIKVVMDFVVNHSSDQHNWFYEAQKSKDNPYRDYYLWATPFDSLNETGGWGQKVWHTRNNTDYYNAVFWGGMPDLNMRNPAVRNEIKNAAKFWLDPNSDGNFDDGVDGFRLDAALHIDSDMDVTHNWWQEFNTFVKSVNDKALLVGENWTDKDTMAPFFKDLDSSFNFDFAGELLWNANGNSSNLISSLATIHSKYKTYNSGFIDSTFLTNHDHNRVGSQLGGNKAKMKLAASLLLTLPGTPFIYYGEELGQLGAGPDDFKREPMDWYKSTSGVGMTTMSKGGFYNSSKYTVQNDGISLEEEAGDASSILNRYKKLIKIRNENTGLFSGDNYSGIEFKNGIYSYKVNCGGYYLLVVHNKTGQPQIYNMVQNASELLSDTNYNSGDITIPAYETMIFKTM